MKLVIVSPQSQYTYYVDHIEAETGNGAMVFKIGHAPIIVSLRPKSDFSFMLQTGEIQTIHLTRPGFLEVDRNGAVAVLNQEIK